MQVPKFRWGETRETTTKMDMDRNECIGNWRGMVHLLYTTGYTAGYRALGATVRLGQTFGFTLYSRASPGWPRPGPRPSHGTSVHHTCTEGGPATDPARPTSPCTRVFQCLLCEGTEKGHDPSRLLTA